jgi:hypothetical protein
MQCTRALGRLKLEGKNILLDDLARNVQSTPQYRSGYSVLTPPLEPDWRVSEEQSPIDGSINVYLSTDSEKSISAWLKSNRTLSLHIRCKENKTNAYIHLRLKPKTEYGSYGAEQTYITLRFDEEKPFQEKFGRSTGGEAVFFPDHISMVEKMIRHEQLLIEFIYLNASPQILSFA